MASTVTFGARLAGDDGLAADGAVPSAGRWRWRIGQVAEALGLPGLAAVLVALFAVYTAVAGILPVTERLQAEQDRTAALQATPGPRTESTRAAPAEAGGGAADLAAFLQRFASERASGAALGQVHRIARRHGIALPQGEFRLLPQEGLPLVRYTMVLPVTAPYASLRAFLTQLLREMPGLALQDLNLQRSESGTPGEVDAKLGFVLYLRAED